MNSFINYWLIGFVCAAVQFDIRNYAQGKIAGLTRQIKTNYPDTRFSVTAN